MGRYELHYITGAVVTRMAKETFQTQADAHAAAKTFFSNWVLYSVADGEMQEIDCKKLTIPTASHKAIRTYVDEKIKPQVKKDYETEQRTAKTCLWIGRISLILLFVSIPLIGYGMYVSVGFEHAVVLILWSALGSIAAALGILFRRLANAAAAQKDGKQHKRQTRSEISRSESDTCFACCCGCCEMLLLTVLGWIAMHYAAEKLWPLHSLVQYTLLLLVILFLLLMIAAGCICPKMDAVDWAMAACCCCATDACLPTPKPAEMV